MKNDPLINLKFFINQINLKMIRYEDKINNNITLI